LQQIYEALRKSGLITKLDISMESARKFYYKGPPAFTVTYPRIYKTLGSKVKYVVFVGYIYEGESYIAVSVRDINQGETLENAAEIWSNGMKEEREAKEIKILHNESVELEDGTPARLFLVQFNYKDYWPREAWNLTVFRDNKIITVGVGYWGPEKMEEIAREILFSLNFDVSADLDEGIVWKSKEEGVAKNGLFVRKKIPAFTFKYPESFVEDDLQGSDIYKMKGARGLPVVSASIEKVTGDVKEELHNNAKGYAKSLEKLGTDIKITYNKPLPEDTYGEEFPAQEFEIEWKFRGSFLLTSYVNVIVKDGYYLSMQGVITGGKGDISEIKAIFRTIDLEP